jgi:Questin oxidase-like
MRDLADDVTRRDFLKSAGVATTLAGAWPGGILGSIATGPQEGAGSGAKASLDALLQQHRDRVLASEGRIGGTLAHVPLALMALHRLGASPAQMQKFFGESPGPFRRPAADGKPGDALTVENWRARLGPGAPYSRWFAFFDEWMRQTSVAFVLGESLPRLIKSGVSAFDHTLIHMSYAIDYGGREEIASALATWAGGCGAEQALDLTPAPVEPDALLAEIVRDTSELKLNPRGGNMGPIVWRLNQVQRHEGYAKRLKPVRVPESNPLKKFSEIILGLFCETHEFTLLHALTTCHALRTLLPYVTDPKTTLSAYWHSVCASYVTVRCMPQFDAARQAVPTGGRDWKEILPKAVAPDAGIHESQYVHRAKVVYSCHQEFKHYGGDLYRAASAREVERVSTIVLG